MPQKSDRIIGPTTLSRRAQALSEKRMHPFLTGEFSIFSIADHPEKIAKVLKRILGKSGKRFQLPGAASFCGAGKHAKDSPIFTSVALILNNRPPDFSILSPSNQPYWREAICAFRERYHRTFQLEREIELVPKELTVISLMPMNRGQLDSAELDEITGQMPDLRELNVDVHIVDSLREAVKLMADYIVPQLIDKKELNLDAPETEEKTMSLPAWEKADKPVTGGMHFNRWRSVLRNNLTG